MTGTNEMLVEVDAFSLVVRFFAGSNNNSQEVTAKQRLTTSTSFGDKQVYNTVYRRISDKITTLGGAVILEKPLRQSTPTLLHQVKVSVGLPITPKSGCALKP